MKVLVIGVNTRHIVCSANRAGYTVHSLSNFADQDLITCAQEAITQQIREVPDLDGLASSIQALLPVDYAVLGPGFEHLGDWMLELIGKNVPILNNPPDLITRVSDKFWLAERLKAKHIPHPGTYPLTPISPIYPAIIKPRYGAGGIENMLVMNSADLGTAYLQLRPEDHYLLQEFVEGTVVSVSVLSTGDEAVAVAVNEQLAGLPGLTRIPFAYCGNITPYRSDHNTWLCDTAIDLALDLRLVGTNGIDFMITDHGPVVLEINPRFQGSIDTVEKATGINIFKAHCDAFKGKLPAIRDYRCYCVKAIFFAPERFQLTSKVNRYLTACLHQDTAADIPAEGVMFEKDDPVVSFIATGTTRTEAIQKVKYLVSGLWEKL